MIMTRTDSCMLLSSGCIISSHGRPRITIDVYKLICSPVTAGVADIMRSHYHSQEPGLLHNRRRLTEMDETCVSFIKANPVIGFLVKEDCMQSLLTEVKEFLSLYRVANHGRTSPVVLVSTIGNDKCMVHTTDPVSPRPTIISSTRMCSFSEMTNCLFDFRSTQLMQRVYTGRLVLFSIHAARAFVLASFVVLRRVDQNPLFDQNLLQLILDSLHPGRRNRKRGHDIE